MENKSTIPRPVTYSRRGSPISRGSSIPRSVSRRSPRYVYMPKNQTSSKPQIPS